MENPSKVVAAATRAAGSRECVSQLPEDWHLARAVHEDLRLMGMPRVNLLLKGTDGVTRNIVRTLLRELREPIAHWSPGERLTLPPVARGGTVILHDVGALPHEDQLHLLEWLEQAVGRTRVISTTSRSLLSRVQAGVFIETLFYRLNTVCVDVSA